MQMAYYLTLTNHIQVSTDLKFSLQVLFHTVKCMLS